MGLEKLPDLKKTGVKFFIAEIPIQVKYIYF